MATENVIIGGGPVATNAAETIRQFDNGASNITLLSDEPAHSRMALPYWLAGQIDRDHTHTADEAYFKKLDVDARIGARVKSIDPEGKSVALEDGATVKFDNLLIATGSTPSGLPIEGADLPGVQSLWTLSQTQNVLDAAVGKASPRVCMIGSGFIGFIMLNAMHKRSWKLSVVEREAHVLPRMLDQDGASILEAWLASKNIDLHCGTTVKRITVQGDAKSVELADGTTLEADIVVIATGVQPNVALASSAGIDAVAGAGGGILVNDRMQTSVAGIYAGGDAVRGPALYADGPENHAIQPTAVDHGRIAGANMAGQEISYPGSLSMNILDVCGLQCSSFGNWNDGSAEAMTIANPGGSVYRRLLWRGDVICGAIFIGKPTDMGMLTDVGMVKGIMQTQSAMGPWKQFLSENPFDVRRPYVALGVAGKLAKFTLLGRPTKTRGFQYGNAKPGPAVGPSHAAFVEAKA